MRTRESVMRCLKNCGSSSEDVPMDPSTETMEAPFLDFRQEPAALTSGAGLMNGIARAFPTCFTTRDASNAASITSLLHCQKLCTECCSETCVFNPQGICMAPFHDWEEAGHP